MNEVLLFIIGLAVISFISIVVLVTHRSLTKDYDKETPREDTIPVMKEDTDTTECKPESPSPSKYVNVKEFLTENESGAWSYNRSKKQWDCDDGVRYCTKVSTGDPNKEFEYRIYPEGREVHPR